MKKYFNKHKTGVFVLVLVLANVGMYHMTSALFQSKIGQGMTETTKKSSYYTKGIQIFSFGYSIIDYFDQPGDKKDR